MVNFSYNYILSMAFFSLLYDCMYTVYQLLNILYFLPGEFRHDN